MDMMKQMVDIDDFDEYLSLCENNKIPPLPIQEYGKRRGYLGLAKKKYPELSWQEAYNKFLEEMNKIATGQQDNGCCKGEKEDKPLPSLVKQVTGYAKNQLEWIAAGRPIVDEETYLHRLSICGVDKDIKCDELTKTGKCSKCGCPMKEKAVRDMQGLCALNKW